ncbi:MAG: hypothetical protein U9O53_00220 [archaeon]|nr:hypothetical protein [archaeon]
MTDNNQKDMPYFIQIRSCINCDASKHHKKITGHVYGFDHESMFSCITFNYRNYTFKDERICIMNPFYDPKEIVRLAKKDGTEKIIKGAIKHCQAIEDIFGEFYNVIGIPIDELIEDLHSKPLET